MTHRYFPHTPEDIKVMLERCNLATLDDLYSDVPDNLKLNRNYDLPSEMSETEVRNFFKKLADKNVSELTCFAGAGYYDHYSPSVIPALLSRSEFLTAYTPYQPEISQGTLQYIFEYQSMMASLTGMEVSNASMYDGSTATAEAMMMAVAHARKRNRVLVSATVNPAVRKVIDTYAHYHNVVVDTIAEDNGTTSRADLEAKIGEGNVAGVIVASPNFYGILEDYTGIADLCHANKALLIMNCVASALGAIKTPGEWGADIAVGDAQSLGMSLSYGGPYLGYMCCTKALIRKMPGRIVGATTDENGRRVFVLTLHAREQHIRRDKATSNICSNQGLMALYATMYLSLLGNKGLREINEVSHSGAEYLVNGLTSTGKMRLKYPDRPYLNEFVIEVDGGDVDKFIADGIKQGILPGVKIAPDEILIAVTELQSRSDMDALIMLAKNTFAPNLTPSRHE